MLFADYHDVTETGVVYIPVVPGRPVVFRFYSPGVDIEVRCGIDKVFSSGEVRNPYRSDYSAEVAGGWCNLTRKVAPSEDLECAAYETDNGTLVKQYKTTTLVTGNVVPQSTYLVYSVSCPCQVHLQFTACLGPLLG